MLSVVSQSDGDLTLNLKAPLVINLDRRLGRQVITSDDQPVALAINTPFQSLLRRNAHSASDPPTSHLFPYIPHRPAKICRSRQWAILASSASIVLARLALA